ncbi:MAG: ComF family protein [Woeseia sp.]
MSRKLTRMNPRHWLDRFLPDVCAFCRLQVARERICSACKNDLPRLGFTCRRCAEPLTAAPSDELLCARCQRQPPPWQSCRAVLPYAWPVDVALQRLKYSRQLVFAAAFGALLAQESAEVFAGVDALCPVPLHRWRHLQRGFNQAEELCRPVRRRTALPLLRNVRRVRHTAAQSGLGQKARQQNLQDAFRVKGTCNFRHPLLIDDIMTTGETCRQLAQLLLEHGAESVSVLVVARAATGVQAGAVVNV